MRRRILASALALCMAFSLAVTASATEGTVPEITGMDITYGGSNIEKSTSNGSYIFTANGNTDVVDYTASVELSSDATFTVTAPSEGQLYVASVNGNTATLKFKVTINNVDLSTNDTYTLTFTNTSGTTWTGGLTNAGDMTIEDLGTLLADQNIQLAPGALGTGSLARTVLVNQDISEVMLILCDPDATIYTVNYVVNNSTITWKLPAGMAMPVPNVSLSEGQSIAWYTDSTCTTALASDAAVSGNTTLYANITGGSTTPGTGDTFYNALVSGQTATIEDLDDWNTFVANSDKAVAGQLIKLGSNINCGNAQYDSLTFAGNFDGCGNTISNATFRAVNSGYYNSTESDIVCSGMFARLGAGQIVANLTLDNITAQYASTYSAPLAGLADGTSSQRVLIQNVQVRNSSASGRTAAGVVGFTRNTTVRFCSSRDTTITGLANGGGIVGINNARVEFCYSTTSPSALPSIFGGSTGGVVSKNVRGGFTNTCWSTMTVVGASDAGGTDLRALVIDPDSEDGTTFTNAGFNAEGEVYWVLGEEDSTDFLTSAVTYTFAASN